MIISSEVGDTLSTEWRERLKWVRVQSGRGSKSEEPIWRWYSWIFSGTYLPYFMTFSSRVWWHRYKLGEKRFIQDCFCQTVEFRHLERMLFKWWAMESKLSERSEESEGLIDWLKKGYSWIWGYHLKLRYSSRIIKSTLLKYAFQWFLALCNYNQCLIPEHFCHSKKILYPLGVISHSPQPHPLATSNLFSIIYGFTSSVYFIEVALYNMWPFYLAWLNMMFHPCM